MVYLAVCGVLVFATSLGLWAMHRRQTQAELSALTARLQASEQRSEQLAATLRKGLEYTQVLAMLMAERGYISSGDIEAGRERLQQEAQRIARGGAKTPDRQAPNAQPGKGPTVH